MKFAWVLNLDAELELARLPFAYASTAKVLQQLAQHGRGSRALLGPEDVLLEPGGGAAAGDFVGARLAPDSGGTASLVRRRTPQVNF